MSIDIGNVIKIGRIRKNFSQEGLGKHIGVSKMSIWSWENGKSSPSADILMKLADLLDIGEDLFPRKNKNDDSVSQLAKRVEIIERMLSDNRNIHFSNNMSNSEVKIKV